MMIYRKAHRVLVQGITGKQGTFWTEKMLECGTTVVGGVNPKCAGETHIGVPVFASAADAMRSAPFDVAVMFIPPAMAKDAAFDAIAAGAKLLVVLTEHIPVQDVMAVLLAARKSGTRIVGPNTAGLVTPGEGFVGIMPGHNPNIFRAGSVGVISRSGSLGRAAPAGKKMGHAGAIVTGHSGSYASKRAAFERAGVIVADTPRDIPAAVSRRLAECGGAAMPRKTA
jgi:succinyl-CoA synthetase alpha subunit